MATLHPGAMAGDKTQLFVEVTQTLLSSPLEDSFLPLIHAAWKFRQHLTETRLRQAPSGLAAILTDCRAGSRHSSTTEARFFEQGATCAVNAFNAALREAPFMDVSADESRRETAILKHGGLHAVQAYRAVGGLKGDGDIARARSTIHDYGGTQALTMYAVLKTSDRDASGLVDHLPADHVSCLLRCISNVNPHRDVAYMIETLFRNRKRPQWKYKKDHIGRASRYGRLRRNGLSKATVRKSTQVPATSLTQLDMTELQPPAATSLSHSPPALGLETEHPNRQCYWSQATTVAENAAMEEAPEHNHTLQPNFMGPETDIRLFLEPDFHFSESP